MRPEYWEMVEGEGHTHFISLRSQLPSTGFLIGEREKLLVSPSRRSPNSRSELTRPKLRLPWHGSGGTNILGLLASLAGTDCRVLDRLGAGHGFPSDDGTWPRVAIAVPTLPSRRACSQRAIVEDGNAIDESTARRCEAHPRSAGACPSSQLLAGWSRRAARPFAVSDRLAGCPCCCSGSAPLAGAPSRHEPCPACLCCWPRRGCGRRT